MNATKVVRTILIAAGFVVMSGMTHAAYPDKPVKIIVSFSPGGIVDTAARIVASELQSQLKQPFVVENRPGAGGLIAHREFLQSKNDGYTLLVTGSGSLSILPFTKANIGYDPYHAFAPIKLLSTSPLMLVANPERVKANTLREFISEAKAKSERGERMSFTTWGEGSTAQMGAVMLLDATGMDGVYIPFKGSSEATMNLLGAHADAGVEVAYVLLPHIKAGKLKPIAIATPERLDSMPDVPTMTEEGFPIVISVWNAMVAKAGTPQEVIDTLSGALDKALAKDEVRKKFLSQGAYVMGGTPEKCGEFISAQLALMKRTAEIAGIVPR